MTTTIFIYEDDLEKLYDGTIGIKYSINKIDTKQIRVNLNVNDYLQMIKDKHLKKVEIL